MCWPRPFTIKSRKLKENRLPSFRRSGARFSYCSSRTGLAGVETSLIGDCSRGGREIGTCPILNQPPGARSGPMAVILLFVDAWITCVQRLNFTLTAIPALVASCSRGCPRCRKRRRRAHSRVFPLVRQALFLLNRQPFSWLSEYRSQ